MEQKKCESQDTLDETFDSLTPFVAEDTPIVDHVDTPPAVGTSKQDKSTLKTKLGALASPFKGKSFHLGPVKKSKLLDSKDDTSSDKEIKESKRWRKKKPKPEDITTDEDLGVEGESEGISGTEESYKGKKKKKGSARSKAGALVRRLGSLGTRRASRSSPEPGVGEKRHSSGSSSLTPASVRRRAPDGHDGSPSEPSLNDDSGSRYDSVENVVSTRPDMSSPISETDKNNPLDSVDCEHPTIKESSEDTERCSGDKTKAVNYTESSDGTNEFEKTGVSTLNKGGVDDVATTHPVSTLPFIKSTWKRKKEVIQEIQRPIESPSPEDALRKRIAFVAQTSLCLSEDKEDWILEEDEEDLSIPKLVKLAQEIRKSSSLGKTDRSLEPTQETERTDDEDFQDTEETHLLPEHGMPPFGDLLDETKVKSDMGTGTSTHSSNPGTERREHLYKILVIGELGTGKTSIIKRYVHQFFSQHYRATIGVDFALKVLNWDSNTTIRLQLWDIAGQERFGNMTRVYYKEAVGAFIVFDVTRAATFDAVVKWKQDLDSKVQLPDGSPIPCILLANKCDQQKEGIVNTPVKMDEYCKEKGFSGWFETSAKENINIEEAARSLVNKILINDKLLQSGEVKDAEKLSLETREGAHNQQKEKQCSC